MVEARDYQFACWGLPKAFVSLPMDRPFYWCSACASSCSTSLGSGSVQTVFGTRVCSQSGIQGDLAAQS